MRVVDASVSHLTLGNIMPQSCTVSVNFRQACPWLSQGRPTRPAAPAEREEANHKSTISFHKYASVDI